MRFTIPQFIEHEAKIVGPLTFKQFVFVGVAGTACFIIYFLIGKDHFFLFFILSIIILGTGAGLAFVKIGGQKLPTILANFFRFSLASKFYIWKRKGTEVTFSKSMEIKKDPKSGDLPLKTTPTSRLKKIKTDIETEKGGLEPEIYHN